jgi:hypothetical protein
MITLFFQNVVEMDLVTRFLTLGFFHQSTPYRSLINRLKRFAYDFVFAEIIASKVVKIGFSGANDHAEIRILSIFSVNTRPCEAALGHGSGP